MCPECSLLQLALSALKPVAFASFVWLQPRLILLTACLTAYIVFGRGGAEAAAAAAAERAADGAEADLLSNLPEKLDEFGRDENVELREEMSRRSHKRATQYRNAPAQPQVCAS